MNDDQNKKPERPQKRTVRKKIRKKSRKPKATRKPGVDYSSLDQIELRPMAWLWPSWFPLGKLTLVVGHPGNSKSLLMADCAARVSCGRKWPDGTKAELGNVIILNVEDDVADTTAPRLKAAGADLSRITTIHSIRLSTGRSVSVPDLKRDLKKIERMILEIGTVRLFILDPLVSFLGDTGTGRDAEIRQVLQPLGELAARHRIAIVGVMHFNKGGQGSALSRVSGSVGFGGAARSVVAVGPNPLNPDQRVMVAVKSNVSCPTDALVYQVQTRHVPQLGDVPRIVWRKQSVPVTAEEVLRIGDKGVRSSNKVSQAGDWLVQTLANGPQSSTDVREAAASAGIAESTLNRAKKDRGIKSGKEGAKWFWRLPEPGER